MFAFLGEIALMVLTICFSVHKIQFDASDCFIKQTPGILMAYW